MTNNRSSNSYEDQHDYFDFVREFIFLLLYINILPMLFNQSLFLVQSNNQYFDLLSNQTRLCPLKSHWIHLEEYLFTSIGLIITWVLTMKIHLTEKRFGDHHALIRYSLLSSSLMILFLTSFVFNINPTETTCQYEQILLHYGSIILLTIVFVIGLFRRMKTMLMKKISLIGLILGISLIIQTLISGSWMIWKKKTRVLYHHRTCFHRVQIDFCIHARMPFLLSTIFLPMIIFLNTCNIVRFTKPFAIAEFIESIISSIGLALSGSMWFMNLFFSTYPQMPYRYVAYVFLLTYIFPR